MNARALAAPITAALFFSSTVALAQEASEKTTRPGKTVVIEVPPDGLRTGLPLNPAEHTVLEFATPITAMVGNPQGAIAKQRGSHHIDVWPYSAATMVDDPPVEQIPLGGNFSVEILDRTVVFTVFEPTDLTEAVGVATVRPISHDLIRARQNLARASDDVIKAREKEVKAREEARAANQAAETAQAEAVAARKVADRERTKAARAKADAREAKADAGKAQAEAEKAQAEAEAARARAGAAESEAEKAKEREKAAMEEARRAKEAQERTLHQMLVTAAREVGQDQVQRLLPHEGASIVTADRLQVEFRQGDWKHGYLVFDTRVRVANGRPFGLGDAVVKTRDGQPLETRIVYPSVAENPGDGVYTTVYPGNPERISFAVKAPADIDTDDLVLHLTEHGSQKPPIPFVVPRYDDAAVAILIPVSAEEVQRREWAKQVVIGPRFSLGGCWLSSGLEGDDNLDATRCLAIGAYAYKGFHDYFTIGVEGLGAWSGDAEFDREPTDITRSAKVFQITGFADARFSRGKYVPYMRLGGGGLVVSYNDGSDTELMPFYSLGGGFLTRIGKHVSIAAGGCMVAGNGQARSLQFDLRLGYGWEP